MDDAILSVLKHLKLGNLLARWDEYMAMAKGGKISAVQLLRHVLVEESKVRKENAGKMRLKRAQIPEILVMETYPFQRQPKLNKKKILAIYDAFEYVEKSQNMVWLGPTGCGKTGLATSFLIQAIERGYSGRYVKFPALVSELYRSVADHSEEKVLKGFFSYDCLLIDEVGYVEVEAVQVGLFFTLMEMRDKKKPTFITSNLGFSAWGSFLKNDRLTAALIDRLTSRSHVINMRNCRSLRPKPNEIDSGDAKED